MNPLPAPIRIVYLEDDESALELVRARLAREGLNCTIVPAIDEPSLRAALASTPDIILSDFNLPSMDGFGALAIRQSLCPSTPFILLSGEVGEGRAVELLRSGVTDFILKDAPSRLVPSIRRCLKEAAEHRERLAAEHSLRESEDRFRRLIENAPDVIFRYRVYPNPGYEFISPAVERISGYRPAEFYADPLLAGKIAHPDDRAKVQAIQGAGQVEEGVHDVRWVRRDGRTIITEQRFTAFRDATGRLLAIEGIARDITEARLAQEQRRSLEGQLLQAQKVETIGMLAGGIAHDFNNILTGILGFAELGRTSLDDPRAMRDYLEEIRHAGERAKELVAQILTFSRRAHVQQVPLDLARCVAEILRFLRASTPATIRIERRLESGTVRADPTQIHQLVLNLATNAIHAIGTQSGALTVTVEPVEVDLAASARLRDLEPGRYVRLSVADTGHGMDAPTVQQIFDPFFTTKPAGVGTGLGLAVVHGIVRAHGAGIAVESTPGVGTIFHIYFPATAASTESRPVPAPVQPGSGERILLVDDEVSIGRFAATRLEQLNFRVAVFSDPQEALAAVSAGNTAFDAMITDFAMPNLNGYELVQGIRRRFPDLPVVIMSGNRAQSSHPLEQLPRSLVIDKPVDGDDLARALHRVLGHPTGSTSPLP